MPPPRDYTSLLFSSQSWDNALLWIQSRLLKPDEHLPPGCRSLTHASFRLCGDHAISSSFLLRDGAATIFTVAGAYLLVLAFDLLAKRSILDQKLSRKLVHVLSGVLFMASWPLFSASSDAKYFAAAAPVLNATRLLIYGLSIFKDEAMIKSVTREGQPRELLEGPFYYVLALLFCVVVYWRDSPIGLVSLCMMSVGDGFADIVGRRFGSLKLPYNKQKSWMGSISMFLLGFSSSIMMLCYFWILGFLQLQWRSVAEKVALVSLTAAVVESLPLTGLLDDNISVPIASILAAYAVF